MKPILNIKDWLKERSEKSQFKFESVDLEVVQRLKDRQYFVVGERLMVEGERPEFIGQMCTILNFQADNVNALVQIENKPYKIFIPINGLELI